MPTFLPLILVLDIVERTVARDFFNEDWAAYLARLARFSRVCNAMRNLVKPVLWTTVRFKSTRQLSRLRDPHKANPATRQLYKAVKRFIGAGPCCRRGDRTDKKAAQIVRLYFPNVEVVQLMGFGRGVLSMAAFASFANLHDLTLENYHIQDIQPSLVLPNLKTLSLVRIFAFEETLVHLCSPRCTPSLKYAFLCRFKFHNEAHDAVTYMPLDKLDLGRLDAVQIDPSNLMLMPHQLRRPEGPCGRKTKVLLSWQAPTTRFYPCGELPEYFQLNIPQHVYTDESLQLYFEMMARNLVYAIEDDYGFKAVILPERLRSPINLEAWLRPSVKTFLQTCYQLAIPIVFYRGGADASSTMSAKFLDYIRSPTKDENPFVTEAKLDGISGDDSSKWTNAVGLEPEEWEDEQEEIDEEEIAAAARELVHQTVRLAGNGPVVVYINI
ncbi:proteophosphoglycan ppg4 [Rhodotorula toruloides]|uniref:Proteophosphoglycan ppg4 n=1 Tax=Rhodotorula toruloides TaxID=5286 RepID=A0A511KCW7_RHOTO|nr:proteophosphoglycan ppg4 [Rhodotorula toruloides]